MALQMKQNGELFEVLGDLTAENANSVKSHFDNFLKEVDKVILSLDRVSTIEPSGAYTMEQLYLGFMKKDKVIQIIGKTNQNIAGIMNETKTSYILSDDHI